MYNVTAPTVLARGSSTSDEVRIVVDTLQGLSLLGDLVDIAIISGRQCVVVPR